MIGKKIQNYEIRAHLGEGGMGTVYRATDNVLGREVALKMLHTPLLQQTQFLDRFRKEARLLAQLLHPNIAVIYNLIEQEGNQYMVMEYVEGKNLDAMLREQRTLNYKWVVPVFLQALEGLRHAHKKGIYHRDIKPSNLILTPDGTVKLMDFGIAMMAGEKRMTQVNRVVGTIEYMAPELIEGKDPSIASDIYATGITMYELLTGKLPFEGNTDFNLMQDILKKKPVALDKMNASVPKALNNIVMKALEKKPENRFADAKEFSQALLQAFPDLKYADLSISHQPAPTKLVQIPSKSAVAKPTVVHHEKSTRPLPVYLRTVTNIKQKILLKENRTYLIAALAVLVLSIAIFVIAGMSRSEPELLGMNDQKKDSVQQPRQEVKKQQQSRIDGGYNDNGGLQPVQPVRNVVNEGKGEGQEEKEKQKEKEGDTGGGKKEATGKDVKKETVKEKEKQSEKQIEKEKEKEEPVRKEDPPPPPPEEEKKEEKKREPKTIRITSAPEVSLYLREPLTTNASEGQVIYFNVISPVRYNGDVIIEKGATATGRIKNVGNKKISIVISKVTGANGEALPLQEVELSGRINDMISNRSYSVPLKRGITIQL